MHEQSYYYRLRGRTYGPLRLGQMRHLAQQARIGRETHVSRDGQNWGKASDWPEILEVVGGIAPPDDDLSIGGHTPPEISGPDPTAVESTGWYYGVNGVQHGPVTLPTLQRMVASHQLSGSDYVFQHGGTDWQQISSVPELSGTIRSSDVKPIINVNVPSPEQPTGSNGLAIAGFILAFFFPFIGLILCLVALSGKNKANRGLAVAGAIIGGLLTLCGCGYAIFIIMAVSGNNF